jgi:hypothetical protein
LTDAAKKVKMAQFSGSFAITGIKQGAYMSDTEISNLDRGLATVCESCPVCRTARGNQQGLANRFVRGVEVGICPFCRAYERVHGRKAHEPAEGQ